MTPRVMGLPLSLEPATVSIVGIILLHEVSPQTGWIAIIAVAGASIGATLNKTRKKSKLDIPKENARLCIEFRKADGLKLL